MFLGLWFCSPLSILHLLSLNSSPPHFSFLSQSKDCETRKRDPVQKLPQWWFPLDRSDPVCIIASLALFGRFCTLRSYLQPLLSLSIPFLFCSCFLLFAVIRSFFLLDLFLFLLLFCFPLFSFFPLLSHCPCAVLPPPIDRRVSLSAPLLSSSFFSPPPFLSPSGPVQSLPSLTMEGFDTMAMPYLASPLSLGNLQGVDYLSSVPGMDLPDQPSNFDSETFVGYVPSPSFF